MKIHVEIEMQAPEEIALAQELLATLRLIADSVKVRNPESAFRIILMNVVAAAQASEAAGTPGPASASLDQAINTAAQEVIRTVQETTDPAALLALAEEFVKVAQDILFSKPPATGQSNPAMYGILKLFSRLQISKLEFGSSVANKLTRNIIAQLAKPRAPNADRNEFFPYVEAFAVGTQTELLKADGAVVMVNKWLKDEKNRCAAITMLGKTLEIAHTQLATKASQKNIQELIGLLPTITEEVFKYDLAYIQEHMPLLQVQQQSIPTGNTFYQQHPMPPHMQVPTQ
eukprot:CAMPEP_0184659534 /NCGR_PEP_ID=MMETSP0308-20130426/30021_1 /TAXON_ID=38269 /ORGANISM="Gloeochaete witrockiana, Strain SAG 46.84" /LENGTH=286 /DNA_ID=CAMNT_0027099429 /DNA_START=84 /DNA_END=944 /DNA_ORIENTATION=-